MLIIGGASTHGVGNINILFFPTNCTKCNIGLFNIIYYKKTQVYDTQLTMITWRVEDLASKILFRVIWRWSNRCFSQWSWLYWLTTTLSNQANASVQTDGLYFHTFANHKACTLVLICGSIMPWCNIIKISVCHATPQIAGGPNKHDRSVDSYDVS
jgi:hypothetical protein